MMYEKVNGRYELKYVATFECSRLMWVEYFTYIARSLLKVFHQDTLVHVLG